MAYQKCDLNWKSLTKRWKRQELEEEGIADLLLFDPHINQVALEDIVRFVNTQTGNHSRNRDMYIIFKRINNCSVNTSLETIL